MLVYDKNTFGTHREVDSNGYLRVDTCNITKTQVAPYLGREIPGWKEMGLEAEKIYYVLRPEEELKKALPTFNNLPLTREHIEVDVENVPKDKIVGSLGDSAEFNKPYITNSLIVYDKKDIDNIMNGKRKELSCAYRYTPVKEDGEFDGKHYDFRMTDIIGNHVALVKEGRAGHDVVVSDTIEKVKEKVMGLFGKKKMAMDESEAKEDITESDKEKIMEENSVDELVQDSWGEETEYNGQMGHYLTTKSGHHIFIPNGTTTKEAISKHFDEIRSKKQKELGENPWRDKYSYEEAKSGLERAKKSLGVSLGKSAAADFDRMISELESKAAISKEKMKEYDAKLHEIYEQCSKELKEAEVESNEGKPESKIKEETEYEDIEFKAPRKREKAEKNEYSERDWESPEHIDIGVPESDNVSYDILDSVMGQMSDGMWENSRAVEKYWQNANITKKDGTIGIKVNTGWRSPYGAMGDEEIREYFARKIKAVAKEELGDAKGGWNRDNETELQYLSRGNRKPVRVKDAYKLYDHLLGRNKK